MNRLLVLLAVLVAPLTFAQGMLIPTDTSMGPLGIKYQRVSAEIIDGAAVTKVEQVFVNSSPRQLEAHYVFPLPKGAALQDFYLWINGKKTKGEVLEKQKATEIYEGIVRRLQDPGLLEYVDTDAFRARVFPVPANGEQKIELTFSQVLDFNAGLYQYHYPLGASSRGAPRLTVKQDFVFSANIKSKTPLRSIYSPTHRLGVSRKGENEAVTGLEMGPGTDISKDLDLFYAVSDKAVGLTFMSHRPDPEQPGFFMALISPRAELKADEVIAKRITFVIDTSGSMMGDRMKLARDTLKYCVQKLNPRDEFNVIRFSTDVEAIFDKPQLATEANVKKAVDFVSGLEAIGGTAIDEAMTRALKDGANRGERPHMVMFITDGHPTVGETDEGSIAKNAKTGNQGSRVFTFGIGDDLNARLLDRIADEGAGTSDFAKDGKDVELKIGGFYDKVANPVLADLQLDLSAFGAYDVYPRRLGDLFKGGQLVVMGRYRQPKDGTVVLSGMFNGKKQVFEYRGEATKDGKQYDFVPRLWAIRKVGYLLEEIRLHGERAELKDEVVALGKKYGIVTPYTSYLVVEDTPLPVAQNVNRPPPPPRDPWMARPEEKAAPRGSASNFSLGGGFAQSGASTKGLSPAPTTAPAMPDKAPRASESAASDDFDRSFGPMKEESFKKADGKDGIAVSRDLRKMKEQAEGERASDPVRSASGRTFIFRSGGWIDSEALSGTAKQLKVKYLSDAYFALLKARPDLKAALALSDRLVIVIGKDKSVVIEPDAGETKADAVSNFLK
ncbi:MAG: VIT domain-containing protein [Myxococcaceae bacterium]